MIKFILTRYLYYFIIGIEVLILPELVAKNLYGEIEYIKFFSYLTPILLMGSYSGYTYLYYNSDEDLLNVVIVYGVAILLFSGFLLYLYTQNIVYIMTVFSVGLYHILEKKVLIKKKFKKAILYKPIYSLLIIAFFYLSNDTNLNLILVYGLAIGIYFIINKEVLDLKKYKWTISELSIKKFYKLINAGFFLNVGTALYSAFLFIDRYFVKNYLYEKLPEYSFSFNVAQMAILGLTTINLVTNIEIGENKNNVTIMQLKKIGFRSLLFYFGLYIFSVIAVIVYTYYSNTFGNLLTEFSLIYLGNGLFFTFGAISPFIFYRGYQKNLSLSILLITVISYFMSFWIMSSGYSLKVLLLKTAMLNVIFVIYGIILIKSIWHENK